MPYPDVQKIVLDNLDQRDAQDVAMPGTIVDEVERGIQSKTRECIGLHDRRTALEAVVADLATDPAVLPSLYAAIGQVVKHHEEVAREVRLLKEKSATTGLGESLAEFKELNRILADTPEDRRGQVRRP